MRLLSPEQTKGMIGVAAKPPGARAATSQATSSQEIAVADSQSKTGVASLTTTAGQSCERGRCRSRLRCCRSKVAY